ncbi:MAG: hypothetical protein F4Z33_01050 [Gemmatimonadales bacterium]|nr:hypothetical protein [Gemmatimonadales bacterium]MYC86699.1 hypothetical protein [Candidatus Palauibacter denitrificans]
MTIILIAAGFFALGLTVVLLFRNAIRADDELDRRWAEVVAQGSRRGAPPSAPDEPAEPAEPA